MRRPPARAPRNADAGRRPVCGHVALGLDEKGLHEYYRDRNLLKAAVTGRHVANAVLFFVTHQTPTTGATIPVDGGLPDATPR